MLIKLEIERWEATAANRSVCPTNPVCHKAAVAAAGHAHPFFVDLRVFFQHQIGKFHQVVVIQHAVTLAADVGKLVALAVTAARIAEKDKVTFVCPELHLMEERGSVNGLLVRHGHPELPDSCDSGHNQPVRLPSHRSPPRRCR